MNSYPTRLAELLEDLLSLDPDDRAEMLIELSDDFKEVPEAVAKRPFPEKNRVPGCESEAFVWAVARDDHNSADLYFAVENPQGISAKAMAVILAQTLSGEPPEVVKAVPDDLVYQIFGKGISMGKGQGLINMLRCVKSLV